MELSGGVSSSAWPPVPRARRAAGGVAVEAPRTPQARSSSRSGILTPGNTSMRSAWAARTLCAGSFGPGPSMRRAVTRPSYGPASPLSAPPRAGNCRTVPEGPRTPGAQRGTAPAVDTATAAGFKNRPRPKAIPLPAARLPRPRSPDRGTAPEDARRACSHQLAWPSCEPRPTTRPAHAVPPWRPPPSAPARQGVQGAATDPLRAAAVLSTQAEVSRGGRQLIAGGQERGQARRRQPRTPPPQAWLPIRAGPRRATGQGHAARLPTARGR
ncbi:hypothetical protein ACVWXU_008654 [Streptomyces sp. TE33382]